MARSKIVLLVASLVSFGISLGASHLDPYFFDVIIGIGINIILAVSLNLINGYTGQFSLGHAGFMAVGAYTAASITAFASRISPSSTAVTTPLVSRIDLTPRSHEAGSPILIAVATVSALTRRRVVNPSANP